MYTNNEEKDANIAVKDVNNAVKDANNVVKDANNFVKDANNALKYIDFGIYLISVVRSSMEKLSLFVYNEAKDTSFLDALGASLCYNQLTINPVYVI